MIATLDSLTQIIEMVSRASAYAILPHGAIQEQVADKKLALVPIKEPAMRRTLYSVRKRSRTQPRVVVIVEQYIKTIILEMVERYQIHASLPEQCVGLGPDTD